MSFIIIRNSIGKVSGYYLYNDTYYYCNNGSWYEYDSYWSEKYFLPEELVNNSDAYFLSKNYNVSYNISDFKNTSYYRNNRHDSYYDSSSSSYDDSDSLWDSSSSWDSSSTDWDSDW